MTVTNVGTFASVQTLLQNMGKVQDDLNNAQVAISSGKKSQTFDGLTGSIEQFTALNAQVARLTGYQQNNAVVVSQLQTSNTALGQIQQIAANLKSLIAGQISGSASSASFSQQLKSAMGSLTGELNTTFEGNYLFSGTRTNAPPVKDPLPTPTQVGTPDASYYQGSSDDITTRIADGQQITPSVRANDAAFQNLYAGIQQALTAAGGAGNTADLQKAENLVDTGLKGVISLQSTVNANILTVQQATTHNQQLQTYYTGLIQNISQSDIVALSTQVTQDQSVLQASFATFARISSLSLANYLK